MGQALSVLLARGSMRNRRAVGGRPTSLDQALSDRELANENRCRVAMGGSNRVNKHASRSIGRFWRNHEWPVFRRRLRIREGGGKKDSCNLRRSLVTDVTAN